MSTKPQSGKNAEVPKQNIMISNNLNQQALNNDEQDITINSNIEENNTITIFNQNPLVYIGKYNDIPEISQHEKHKLKNLGSYISKETRNFNDISRQRTGSQHIMNQNIESKPTIKPFNNKPKQLKNQNKSLAAQQNILENLSEDNSNLNDNSAQILDQTAEHIYEEVKYTQHLAQGQTLQTHQNNTTLVTQNNQNLENEQLESTKPNGSISVDQYKMFQNIKNPIGPCQLILISITYTVAIVASIPLSLKALKENTCDLNTNFENHFIFLIFVAPVLLVTEIYSMIISKKLSAHNKPEHVQCEQTDISLHGPSKQQAVLNDHSQRMFVEVSLDNSKIDHSQFCDQLSDYMVDKQEIKIIITDKNQDIIAKSLAFYVIKNVHINQITISFQNQKELIQQNYRDAILRTILNSQTSNIRLKEFTIFNSRLSHQDFVHLKRLIVAIPKLQRLQLSNVKIFEKEFDCIDCLFEVIPSQKNFRDLILQYQSSDKVRLYKKIEAFLDWEFLAREVQLKHCKNLDLTKLQELSSSYQDEYQKREKTNLIHLIIDKLDENKNLEQMHLRFVQDTPDIQKEDIDNNKYKLDEIQVKLLLDHIKDYDKITNKLRNLSLIHSSKNTISLKDDIQELMITDILLKLPNLRELKLQYKLQQ
eukprot:403335385